MTTASTTLGHPDWCRPRLCRADVADVEHRELPTVLVPADDPEHMVAVGLGQSDEDSPTGWVVHEPEVAISIRREIAHLSLAELDEHIAALVALRDRARASQTIRAC